MSLQVLDRLGALVGERPQRRVLAQRQPTGDAGDLQPDPLGQQGEGRARSSAAAGRGPARGHSSVIAAIDAAPASHQPQSRSSRADRGTGIVTGSTYETSKAVDASASTELTTPENRIRNATATVVSTAVTTVVRGQGADDDQHTSRPGPARTARSAGRGWTRRSRRTAAGRTSRTEANIDMPGLPTTRSANANTAGMTTAARAALRTVLKSDPGLQRPHIGHSATSETVHNGPYLGIDRSSSAGQGCMSRGIQGSRAFSVTRDGVVTPVSGAPKYQLLLAALLAKAGQPVTIDWLIAIVWGDRPPASARRNVHLYVHQLRRAFGADLVAGRPGGYAIIPEASTPPSSAGWPRRGPRRSTRAIWRSPRDRLRQALDLWRGPAFAEFLDSPPIAEEGPAAGGGPADGGRTAGRGRARAGPPRGGGRRAGRADQGTPASGRARAGSSCWPSYRSGRQAEALEVFRETREELDAQLGIEPGPALQRLHEAMLRGDDESAADGGGVRRVVSDVCPYRGLMAFQPEDQEWFFGRSDLVARLTELVEEQRVVRSWSGRRAAASRRCCGPGCFGAGRGRSRARPGQAWPNWELEMLGLWYL